MNFESLQNAWQRQDPAEDPAGTSELNAKLLERIRRNQQGYYPTMVLAVLKDVLALAIVVASMVFVAKLGPGMSPKVARIFEIGILTGVVIQIAVLVVILRRVPGMLAIRAGNSPFGTDQRIRRDARRSRSRATWERAKQIVIFGLMVPFVVILTARVGLHGPWRWVAIGLMCIPPLAALAGWWSGRSTPAPPPDESLADSLSRSIRETETQMRLMKRSCWLPPVHLVAIVVAVTPVWLRDGRIQPGGWVLLGVFAVIWTGALRMKRWALRRLLPPRLAELKSLRAGLAAEAPPER